MNNNPRKSKALLITLIIILVFILGVYLLYKNKDSFGPKTSTFLNRVFSPLGSSKNTNELEVVQAGEDIKKGDEVSILSGTTTNNAQNESLNGKDNVNTNIIIKARNSEESYGTAYEDISSGDLGRIIKKQKKQQNEFYDSFSKFLDGLFDKENNRDENETDWENNPNNDPNNPNYPNPNPNDPNNPNNDPNNDPNNPNNDPNNDPNNPNNDPNNDPNYPNPNPNNDPNYPNPNPNNDPNYPNPNPNNDPNYPNPNPNNDPNYPNPNPNNGPNNNPNYPNPNPNNGPNNPNYPNPNDPDNPNPNDNSSDITAGMIYPIHVPLNKDVKLYAPIINQGGKEIGESFFSFFSIKNNSEENIYNESVVTPKLEGNTITEMSITYKFTKEGYYNVRACGDKKDQNDSGKIGPESNENNNCGPWTIILASNSLPTDGEKCENGAINPPECTVNSNNKCINGKTNPPTCDKSYNDEDNESNKESNKCLLIEQNPLVFTDEEESELAELLRKYYVIAPSLKTEDDISIIYKDIDRYKTEIENIENLTYQCKTQTSPSNGYTGPTTRGGNPWYNYTNRTSYIGGGSSGDCKGSVSSDYLNSASWTYWFNGIPDDLEVCNSAYRNESSYNCMYGMRGHMNMLTGCTWTDGNYIDDYEKILNIW